MSERGNQAIEALIDQKLLELMALLYELKGDTSDLRGADANLLYVGTLHPAMRGFVGSALNRKPYQTLQDPLGEALNSGDGSYRP